MFNLLPLNVTHTHGRSKFKQVRAFVSALFFFGIDFIAKLWLDTVRQSVLKQYLIEFISLQVSVIPTAVANS
jgi:hypothetical protein